MSLTHRGKKGRENVPPREMVATLFYGYCAFIHEVRYETWSDEECKGVK